MFRFASTLLCWVALSASAMAQSCDDDSIRSVSDDGAIIVMTSGAVFRVNPVDRIDTALWLAADDVLICDDDTEIVNKDEDGEHVAVKRLR
jgi:hypothetical protein